jgi:hypothetical protein
MADRMIHITWTTTVSGREERALEVFNESMGVYGRMQQEGRIESFDVALLTPNGHMDGFISLRGSAEQMAAVRESEDFQRTIVDASLIVTDLCVCDGYANEGVARQMAMFQEAIGRVPQMA